MTRNTLTEQYCHLTPHHNIYICADPLVENDPNWPDTHMARALEYLKNTYASKLESAKALVRSQLGEFLLQRCR